MTSHSDNQPLHERYRLIGEEWVDADRAASLMEETKSAVFSEIVVKLIERNLGLAVNKAEALAKASPEYKEFVTTMVDLRSKANLLKVRMDYLKMRFQELMSVEATARAERRL